MIKAAGAATIEQEIYGHDLTKSMFDTSAGQLKQTKRLLFVPWSPPSAGQSTDALRQSIAVFINQAIKFTIAKGFQSVGKFKSKGELMNVLLFFFLFSVSGDWLRWFWTVARSYSIDYDRHSSGDFRQESKCSINGDICYSTEEYL